MRLVSIFPPFLRVPRPRALDDVSVADASPSPAVLASSSESELEPIQNATLTLKIQNSASPIHFRAVGEA